MSSLFELFQFAGYFELFPYFFCSHCLENFINSSTDKTDSVSCPLCRVVTPLPENGVRGLKVNHYLKNIVDKLRAAQSTKMCAECDRSIATCFCKQCRVFLCNDCNEKVHNLRVMGNHDRIAFEECFLKTQVGSPPTKPVSRSDILWEVDCVIPFNVKKQVAIELFHAWLKSLWFAPTNLDKKIQLIECKAMFIPHWLFEVEAFTTTTPDRFENKKSETLDSTASSSSSSSSRRSSSTSNSQTHYKKYTDVMVPAIAFGSNLAPLELLEPFKLDEIQPFTLYHAQETVDVRPFLLTADIAFEEHAKPKLERMQKDHIQRKQPNSDDSSSNNDVKYVHSFSNRKERRVFVPIYSIEYSCSGETYRFWANGSTAKHTGTRPYSPGKLASLSFTGIGAALGLLSTKFV